MQDMMMVLKLDDDSFVVQSGTSERLTLYTAYAVKQLIGILEKSAHLQAHEARDGRPKMREPLNLNT